MSVSVERTRDYGLIDRLLKSPEVYNFVTDDGSPAVSEFSMPQLESLICLVMQEDEVPFGVCFFFPLNCASTDMHIATLSGGRGKRALIGAKLCIEWIWNNTEFCRVECRIPAFNKPAMRLAALVGLERVGVCKKAFLKDDVLYDQVLMGITKGV